MILHTDVVALFKRFLLVFPVPNGAPGDEAHFQAMRGWIERFCQQVRHDFPDGMPGVGGEFGWKRASPSRPASKESLAMQTATGLHGWDLFVGVGTGNPQANFNPPYHDLWNPPEGPQTFIPVTPVNHLAGATVTPPTPGRALLTGPWIGKSAFNLLERTPAEQERWLEFFGPGTIHRVMLARTKDSGRDTSWTPEHGLTELSSLLDRMQRHRARMHLTVHCDTKLYGQTPDDVRRITRQVGRALDTYDTSVVASVQGFNEPVHSTQYAYCVDEALNAELETLIPLKFPYTRGPVTHGALVGTSTHGTIHGDRSLSPEENATHAANLVRVYGRPFVDDEPLGIDEVASPGRRTNDPDYARRLAQAALDQGLLGATLHSEAGLTADVQRLGPIHRRAWEVFRAVFPLEVVVTPDQVAQVLAGTYFEDISKLLNLPGSGVPGTEDTRRPAVHGWAKDWLTFLDSEYRRIFTRPLDLEAAGSRILLAVHGKSKSWMTTMLEQAKRDGAS